MFITLQQMHFFRFFRRLWWKGTISFITYLRMEQLGFHRRTFRKIFWIFTKICDRIQVWLQRDKVFDFSHEVLRNACEYIAVYETVTRNSIQREGTNK